MIKKTLLSLALSASIVASAGACTGISLTTATNAHIQARSVEWGESNLNSKLIISPRGYQFTSTMPDQQQGLSWKSKYGFVGISVSDDRFIGEGINEEGLTAGLFLFSGYGSLKAYDPKSRKKTIVDMDFVRWMLSQFKTVDEVKAAMKKINIAPVFLDAKGQPSPTAHWRVTDRSGKNIVIEITDHGVVHVYDNDVGVLTNVPSFPWQVTNLSNYIHLQPGTRPPAQFGAVKAESPGAGSGFLGLPGDITSPSRFVRAAFYLSTAPQAKTSEEAVAQAFHILNSFDIPIGAEFSPEYRDHIPADMQSATQWTSVIDQDSGLFYYKTMYDGRVKKVDLNKVDFAQKEEMKRALDAGSFVVEDATP